MLGEAWITLHEIANCLSKRLFLCMRALNIISEQQFLPSRRLAQIQGIKIEAQYNEYIY